MNETASISVVIPAYNARSTIDEALHSVFAQTVAPLEVILVDDGSDDGTAAWVRSQFPSVTVVEVSNGGPSRARNCGIARCRGEFVAFLDADDRWHPLKLQRQLRVLQAEPAVGLIASDWVRMFAAGPPALLADPKVTSISFRKLLVLNRFQTSTVVARRELLQRVGGFDPSVDGAEDWDLWVRVAEAARVKKVDEPLVMYRDVGSGYSKDVWRLFRTMQPTLEKHRAKVPTHEFRVIEAWHYLRFWVAFRLLGDHLRAQWVLQELGRRHLWPYVPEAGARYLLPFLGARWSQRMRRMAHG